MTPAQRAAALSNVNSIRERNGEELFEEVSEVEFTWGSDRKLHAFVNGQELKGNEGAIQPDPSSMAGATGWVTQDKSAGKVTSAVTGMQLTRTALSEVVQAGVTDLKGLLAAGKNITMFGGAGAEDKNKSDDSTFSAVQSSKDTSQDVNLNLKQ